MRNLIQQQLNEVFVDLGYHGAAYVGIKIYHRKLKRDIAAPRH